MSKSTGVARFGPKIDENQHLGLGSGSHGLQELKKRVPGPKTGQKKPKNGSPWALLACLGPYRDWQCRKNCRLEDGQEVQCEE